MKMDMRSLLHATSRFVATNSPTILTSLGAVGVISTAVLTGKASYSAAFLIQEANQKISDEGGYSTDLLNPRQSAELVWREFIPAAIVGTASIVAVVAANRVGAKRAAALAAAFKISENLADEYRDKVIEKVGKKQEEMIRADLAKDRVQRAPGQETLVITGSQALFYDEWSGRAFLSTKEKVDQAINQINYKINHQWCASLTEFYDLLDLSKTQMSDEFGWNSDELLDVYFSVALVEENKPALSMRYNVVPKEDFSKVR